jgi:hypothetical protein
MTNSYLYQKQDIVCSVRGDCASVALACVLGIHKSQVPKFVADAYDSGTPGAWNRNFHNWLRENNIRMIEVAFKDIHDYRAIDGIICDATMPSQMYPGGTHAVVGGWFFVEHEDGIGGYSEFRVVNDPNPFNKPYNTTGIDGVKPIYCRFYFKSTCTMRIR